MNSVTDTELEKLVKELQFSADTRGILRNEKHGSSLQALNLVGNHALSKLPEYACLKSLTELSVGPAPVKNKICHEDADKQDRWNRAVGAQCKFRDDIMPMLPELLDRLCQL